MRDGARAPLVLLAAGGTGGHLFPAEALAAVLRTRGCAVHLATDDRALRYQQLFSRETMHLIRSDTLRGRDPLSLARTFGLLGQGVVQAWRLIGRLGPAAVVGFGGYPTIPPVMAATLRRVPTVIHDANAVIGRANKWLAPRVDAIATTFPGIVDYDTRLAAKAVRTGNPLRPAVVAAAAQAHAAPRTDGPLHLLVFGGSQGARIMAEIVPPAISALPADVRRRLTIVQQAREEDLATVSGAYAKLGVVAEVAPFFADLPTRIAAAHVVVSRSGATTVAELAGIGRPAILVPLPHALDQDQLANANVLVKAGGAILLTQDTFTPDRLMREIATLAADPARLAAMAAGAKSAGAIDAADRLADLVIRVAGISN